MSKDLITLPRAELQRGLELLAVATFHSPAMKVERTAVINAGLAALEQPGQEPGSMHGDWYDSNSCDHCGMVGGHTNTCRHYTAPQSAQPAEPAEPLTDEQADAIQRDGNVRRHLEYYARMPRDSTAIALVKAIAAQGIKEQS